MSSYNVCYVLAGIFGIGTRALYQLCRKSEAMKLQYHLGFYLIYGFSKLAPPSSTTGISIVCTTSLSVMMTRVQYAYCKTTGWNYANSHVGGILPCTHNMYTCLFMTHVDLVRAMERQKWNSLYTLRWRFPWSQYVCSKHGISTCCHDNYTVMVIWLPWFCTSCISIVWWVLAFDR